MRTHTPGPWKVLDDEIVEAEHPESAIATVDWIYDDDGYANARLIAAAPELLSACKKYGVGCHPICDHDPVNCSCGWRELARAIAKAEGGA